MTNKVILIALAVLLASAGNSAALAQTPPTRGELLFQTCTACHNVLGDGLGPDLTGIYGQKSATRAGYAYSEALRSSGLVWDEATLRRFIRSPQTLVPGTKMTFVGYSADADVDAVVAFLKTYR